MSAPVNLRPLAAEEAMNRSMLEWMLALAMVNALATLLVFIGRVTKSRLTIPTAFILPALAVLYVFARPSAGESTHPFLAELTVTILTIGIVWSPGAILAIVGGSLNGVVRTGAGIAAALVSAACGALLPVVGLATACYVLGECL